MANPRDFSLFENWGNLEVNSSCDKNHNSPIPWPDLPLNTGRGERQERQAERVPSDKNHKPSNKLPRLNCPIGERVRGVRGQC